MTFEFDTSAAVRGTEALRNLVLAIAGSHEHDESESLEWKRILDLTTAKGCFAVARTVLGLANRDPDRSALAFEGYGYIVVGAEPGNVHGLDSVDPAQLDDLISPYIGGSRGPSWSANYVRVQDRTVLVATVEPPRRGHPLWPLRKELDGVAKGMVFVRRAGKTVRADDAEIDMLSARAAAAPAAPRLELSVEAIGDIPLPWVDASKLGEQIDTWVTRRRDALISAALETERARLNPDDEPVGLDEPDRDELSAGLLSPGYVDALRSFEKLQRESNRRLSEMVQNVGSFGMPQDESDDRTIDAYTAEVDRWASKLRRAAHEQLRDRFAAAAHGEVLIRVRNLSDSFLSDVEVTVYFPQHDAKAAVDEPDVDELPRPPRTYGQPRRVDSALGNLLSGAGLMSHVPYLPRFDPPSIGRTFVEDGSIKVTFDIGDLRPQRSDDSDSIWVFLPSRPDGGVLIGQWEASAREMPGLVTGEISVGVADLPFDVVSLLED